MVRKREKDRLQIWAAANDVTIGGQDEGCCPRSVHGRCGRPGRVAMANQDCTWARPAQDN